MVRGVRRGARLRSPRRKPRRAGAAYRTPLFPDRPVNTSTFLATAGLGVAAGMRSMTAPAALAHVLSRRTLRPDGQPARLLASPRVAGLARLAAAGEYVGDKMPFAPDRTDALPLGGRIGSGALVGAAAAAARRESLVLGAVVGAAAAVAGSFAMVRVRKALPGALGVPDLPVALAEDAAAVALALVSARAAVRATVRGA